MMLNVEKLVPQCSVLLKIIPKQYFPKFYAVCVVDDQSSRLGEL
jgi:hypothetical protein